MREVATAGTAQRNRDGSPLGSARVRGLPSPLSRGGRAAELLVSGLIAFTALLRLPGMSIIPVAAPLSLVILPVLAYGSRPVRRLMVWVLLLLLSGIVLSLTIPGPLGTPGAPLYVEQTVLWIIGGALTISGLSWAVRKVGLRYSLVLVGIGAIVSTALDPAVSTNWWKFGGSTGIMILAILLTENWGWVWRPLLTAGLALVNIVFDFRSLAIICFLLFCVTIFSRPITAMASRGRWPVLLLLGGLATSAVGLFTFAVSSGLAGQSLLERTQYQTSLGQNPILSGRTEWAATLDLMQTYIWGFGPGTRAAADVVRSAVYSAGTVGGDTAGPYFYTEVFSNRVDLHSSLANLWYHFGLVGLAASVAILWVLYTGANRLLKQQVRYPITLLSLYILAGWDLFFSPMADSAKIALALGVAFATMDSTPTEKAAL